VLSLTPAGTSFRVRHEPLNLRKKRKKKPPGRRHHDRNANLATADLIGRRPTTGKLSRRPRAFDVAGPRDRALRPPGPTGSSRASVRPRPLEREHSSAIQGPKVAMSVRFRNEELRTGPRTAMSSRSSGVVERVRFVCSSRRFFRSAATRKPGSPLARARPPPRSSALWISERSPISSGRERLSGADDRKALLGFPSSTPPPKPADRRENQLRPRAPAEMRPPVRRRSSRGPARPLSVRPSQPERRLAERRWGATNRGRAEVDKLLSWAEFPRRGFRNHGRQLPAARPRRHNRCDRRHGFKNRPPGRTPFPGGRSGDRRAWSGLEPLRSGPKHGPVPC